MGLLTNFYFGRGALYGRGARCDVVISRDNPEPMRCNIDSLVTG